MLIKKGGHYFEDIKVIIPDAIPFWKEILNECKDPEHYLFSTNFSPGPVPIAARQVSRKWNKYIKKRYSYDKDIPVTADFYTAKHLFLDMLDAMQHENKIIHEHAAQTMASHKSSKITDANYLINKKKRERDALKKITFNVVDIYPADTSPDAHPL